MKQENKIIERKIKKLDDDCIFAYTTLVELILNLNHQYPEEDENTQLIYRKGLFSLILYRFNKLKDIYSNSK